MAQPRTGDRERQPGDAPVAGDAGESPDAVFVIGAPGSGGTALARALAALPACAPLDREPVAADAAAARGDRRERGEGIAGDGQAPASSPPTASAATAVDGAPRRTLQVAALAEAFARPRFILCWRPPQEAMAQAYRAWSTGRAVTHSDLEGWEGPPWSFALVPDWEELAGEELGTIVAEQWARVTRIALDDLAALEPSSWAVTSRAALRSDPAAELGRLCGFVGIDAGGLRAAAEALRSELEAEPAADPTPADLTAALPRTVETARRAAGWLAAPQRGRGAGTDPAAAQSPLRSVHTGSMPTILGELGCSLLVSTYQAGKLILARKDGVVLNTHFRNFEQPMGLATRRDRLAIGTRSAILEYRNMPAAAPKLEPAGTHDGCYIFRRSHVTGDVRIHDVGYAGDELWFVATGFSCLATLDDEHSFVPRWRPPFVSKLSPTDRCHLNGMEVVDDEVRWATALGQTDSDGGWRENRASGGCLIHVPSDEVVLAGISMPHSPRWHDGRLWMLESGEGGLCTVDAEAGSYETVVELPGFTRGLTFAGPFALVGLSQVRETATFGGLPLTERLDERLCGVWAVDLRSGEIAGFLRFQDAVQEVYDVAVLPGMRKPEIAELDSDTTRHSYVIKGWQD